MSTYQKHAALSMMFVTLHSSNPANSLRSFQWSARQYDFRGIGAGHGEHSLFSPVGREFWMRPTSLLAARVRKGSLRRDLRICCGGTRLAGVEEASAGSNISAGGRVRRLTAEEEAAPRSDAAPLWVLSNI